MGEGCCYIVYAHGGRERGWECMCENAGRPGKEDIGGWVTEKGKAGCPCQKKVRGGTHSTDVPYQFPIDFACWKPERRSASAITDHRML